MEYTGLSQKTLQAIQDFEKLPNEWKVKKVIALLEGIKEKSSVFVELLEAIQTRESVPDDILVGIYTDIMALGEATIIFDKKKKMGKLDEMKNYLKKLQLLEQEEKAKEDPDAFLNGL